MRIKIYRKSSKFVLVSSLAFIVVLCATMYSAVSASQGSSQTATPYATSEPVSKTVSNRATDLDTGSTKVSDLSADSQSNSQKGDFEIISATADRADLGGGNFQYRIYDHPRAVYVDTDGKMKLRGSDWYLFDQMEKGKIQSDSNMVGYNFTVDLDKDALIQVSAGDFEFIEDEVLSSAKNGPEISRQTVNEQLVSTISNVYPNIDIRFIDSSLLRQREIVIKAKPEGITADKQVVFWEDYVLPDQAQILLGEKDYDGTNTKTKDTVLIRMPSGNTMSISPAVIFDSRFSDPIYLDRNQVALEQIVKYDSSRKKLSIGIVVDGSYLIDETKVYPLIIDPTYTICQSGSTCLTNFYLRWLNDKNLTNTQLFTGSFYSNATNPADPCYPAGPVSRHIVVKFDLSAIPSNYTIDSADLKMNYISPSYCGVDNQPLAQFSAKKIGTSWSESSITYSGIRSSLSSMSPTIYVNSSCSGNVCNWQLDTNTVKGWLNNPSSNYGLVVEPTPNWSSGSSLPSNWPTETYVFYSSRYGSGSSGPYVVINASAPGLPDLNNSYCTVDQSSVQPGGTVTGQIRIDNSGSSNASANHTHYYFYPGTSMPDSSYLLSTMSVPAISAGSYYYQNYSMTVPSNYTNGTYYVHFWLDSWNEVAESNESNTYHCNASVSVVNPTYPNLDLGGAQLDSTSVNIGGNISGYIDIINNGSVSAGSSDLSFYLSPYSSSYSSGDEIKTYYVSSIGAGNTTRVNYTYVVPSTQSTGQYYLHFFIDSDNDVSESDESDNEYHFNNPITISNPTYPDLEHTNAYLNTTQAEPGDSLSGYVDIYNSGSAIASGNYIAYYLCSSANYPSSACKIADYYVSSINAGSTYRQNYSYTIPSSITPGTYYLHFLMDYTGVVSESDENNNWAYFTNPITISNLPDFAVSSGTMTDTSYHTDGQTLTYKARIRNLGSAGSSSVNYKLVLQNQSNNSYYELTGLSPSSLNLPAGYDNSNVLLTGTIPSSIPSGQAYYKLRLELDPNNAITEADETNNNLFADNQVLIEGQNYGGNPTDDDDSDGFVNSEEKLAGTNVAGSNTYTLKDTNYHQALSIAPDIYFQNYGADPVNLRTGALELKQTIFELPGRGQPINLYRVYNSKLSDWNGRLGWGWNFSYNNFYYKDPTDASVQIYLEGNLSDSFTTSDSGATYISSKGSNGSLVNLSGTLIYRQLDGISYQFSKQLTNNLGLIEKIIDTNGNETNFTYTDANGIPLLTAIVDASGRQISLTYGNSTSELWDKIVSVSESLTGSSRIIAEMTYNTGGYLTKVKQYRYYAGATESAEYSYGYDVSGRLTTYTNPLGMIIYSEYDSSNRVIAQYEYNPRVDASGTKRKIFGLSFSSGADPEVPGSNSCMILTTYRSASDFYTDKLCFNSDNLKIFAKNGAGNIEKWTYDSQGMPATYTDRNNQTTVYQYDNLRRQINEVLPATSDWKTETGYEYSYFNRVGKKTATSTPLTGGTVVVKTNNYVINSANGNLMSETDSMGFSQTYTYDTFGNPLTFMDKNGKTTTYQYDANGNYRLKESITTHDADGNSVAVEENYLYDVYGNLNSHTTPNNNIYTYVYDSRGHLRIQTNPMGDARQYVYDALGHRVNQTDELNHQIKYTYDTDLNASLLKTEAVGASQTITNSNQYDYSGNLVAQADPLSRTTTYQYDNANRVSQKSGPLDTIIYTYYSNGQIKSQINSLGQKAEYYYDSRGQLTETRQYLDAVNYISLKTIYDGFGRKIANIDANGNTTTYSYNLNDQLISVVDATGAITSYIYDKVGNKTGVLLPLAQTNAGLRNSSGQSESYQYDELNQLIKTINAQNKVSLKYYDKDGNVTKIIDRQNSDGSANSHVSQFVYDKLGRLTSITDATGAIIGYAYDKVGNKTSQTDPVSRTITYTYDEFNRLISQKDAANNLTKYNYDLAGNKTSVIFADNTSEQYTYNQINLLAKITDQLGKTEIFTYDAIGNKLSWTDKNSQTINYVYDRLNRLSAQTDPKGVAVVYNYDKNSNKLTETVNGAKITAYQYDALNQNTKITRPGNIVETYTYDKNGNLTGKTDGASQTITYTYDSLDRLTAKQLPDSANPVSYIYDNWNNLTKLSDESGVTNYVYDNNNRNTSEVKVLVSSSGGTLPSATVARAYYADGHLKTLLDASGKLLTYSYNNIGLLDKVSYGASDLAQYVYNSLNRPQTITYGNGVVGQYTYDSRQMVTKIDYSKSGKSLFAQEYQYDADGNRLSVTQDGVATTTYAYDVLGQLVGVDYLNIDFDTPTYDLEFTYDNFGNRTKATAPNGQIVYTYGHSNDNQLTSYSLNSRLDVSLAYDGNGSLKTETYTRFGQADHAVNYSFDSQNRLKQIVYNYDNAGALVSRSNNVLKFLYDDAMRRTMKQSNASTTYYLNDGLTVLNELNEVGETVKLMVRGLGPVAEIDSAGKIHYIHQDTLGSAVMVTDESGHVEQKYEYDPFGQLTGAIMGLDESVNTRYLYTGQEFDSESDLYYYGARYYNPLTGRFISRDPKLSRGGTLGYNEYVYAFNNPFGYIDPSGEVNWGLMWEGTKQTVFGGLTTVFGAAEVAAGIGIATGGTAASGGLAAPVAVAGGVVVGAMGVNNVVAGTTQASGGLTNLWNGLWDNNVEAVDYTFNPAHEAIDAVTEEGSTANTVAHIGYDVTDLVFGTVGIMKAGSMTSKAVNLAEEASKVKVPNPHGKAGGPAHQQGVINTVSQVEKGGLEAIKEYQIRDASGRIVRYVDVAGVNPITKMPVEFYQVGKTTQAGLPVAREIRAIAEIEKYSGITSNFVSYNSLITKTPATVGSVSSLTTLGIFGQYFAPAGKAASIVYNYNNRCIDDK